MFAIICQAVAYWRFETKKKFKLLAIKVVEVAYERWSFTRGSKEIDLTMKMLVAYDRWSQPEFRLYYTCYCWLLP